MEEQVETVSVGGVDNIPLGEYISLSLQMFMKLQGC